MNAFVNPNVVGAPLLASRFQGKPLICANGRSLRQKVIPSLYRNATSLQAKLDALIFDCDGVLADTERDAHRVAFNLAFEAEELDVEWDEALYGKLLETGGGKERMTAYFSEVGWPSGYEEDKTKRSDLVRRLHARKTELFMELVKQNKVPLRDGVARLAEEAHSAGVPVAVCSTSNEKAVSKIVDMLGADVASRISIYAGDVVENKKPSPDIYNLAKDSLSLDPSKVCVVEDSFIGVAAARSAGMPVVVTKSTYTVDEDFSKAQRVLNSLDDPKTTLDDLTKLVEGLQVRS